MAPGLRLAGLLAVAALRMGDAGAGSFAVNPVRVVLGPSAGAAVAMSVRNNAAEPAVVQVDAMRWSQQDGADQLEPTRELLATPPLFTLAPGGTQIVRIGLRSAAAGLPAEATYRLLLREILPDPPLGQRGVRMALQLSVPVFATGTAAVAPVLQWEARRAGDLLELEARNDGNAHVQILRVEFDGGVEAQPRFTPVYLLAGQRRRWQVGHPARAGEPLPMVVRTDAGEMAARPVVAHP